MADEFKIEGIERITPRMSSLPSPSKRKKRDKKQHKDAGKSFSELSRKAEQAHRILSEKKSPYRFCVYREGEDIFIDVAIVDANRNIIEVFKRNITNDEFHSWIDLIEAESGLIFDKEI